MHITAQGPRLRNDLYCVEWDVKLYYTIHPRLGASIHHLGKTVPECHRFTAARDDESGTEL